MPTFSAIDWVLLFAVAAQCLLTAYLRRPLAKAFMLTIPVPVTLGILSVGQPINVIHAAGLLVSMGFTLTVLLLHRRLRAPIVAAIAIGVLFYGAASMVLGSVLPRTEQAFWLVLPVALGVATVARWALPPRPEPLYRSPMPVGMKAAVVLGVVFCLLLLKHQLQGFMATFPMLGVIASYETRKSLYTTSRVIPVSITAFALMFCVCRLLQDQVGVAGSLPPGLLVYGLVIVGFKRRESIMENGCRMERPGFNFTGQGSRCPSVAGGDRVCPPKHGVRR